MGRPRPAFAASADAGRPMRWDKAEAAPPACGRSFRSDRMSHLGSLSRFLPPAADGMRCRRGQRSPILPPWLALASLATAVLSVAGPVRADDPLVVFTPQATDELLANPGIGWETFGTTRDRDAHLPDWIPSTIAYYRWNWRQLEPRPSQLDSGLIDRTLAACRAAGQKLALRVMTCSPTKGRPYHPAWLADVGGRELTVDYGEPTNEVTIPDFDDKVVLERHLDLIRRLGARYDGHPDLDHVDIGSIGWWGEWHLSRCKRAKLPAAARRKQVLDAYLAAFRRTPLVMLINGESATAYATRHGTGWRADSLGDLGSFSPTWNHMQHRYPAFIRTHGLERAWKRGPITFEPPHDVAEFVSRGWPLRTIFNYALALHGSSFSGKSAQLPDDPRLREELERFLRRLGYRFVLEEVAHPAQAVPGQPLVVRSRFKNIGSAPCYRPYRLAYRLVDAAGRRHVVVGPTTVRDWLPGSASPFLEAFAKTIQEPADLPPGPPVMVTDEIELPRNIAAGACALSIGIVGVDDESPAVRLAIEGRDAEGWYPVGPVTLGR
jgi:hypothetical protein